MDVEGALFVHGSPCRPGEWNYIITREDAQHNFGSFDQAVCFVGHSHVPEIFLQKPAQAKISKLDRTNRCIINVGSIGQPRDGDWRLSFGILDTEEWTYENVRAEYDVRSAYRKILEAGLPRILAERLLVGK
jgi:diadenosine tetraphosphatase ApaH/serine/threonine PP2A family protein phosphatase